MSRDKGGKGQKRIEEKPTAVRSEIWRRGERGHKGQDSKIEKQSASVAETGNKQRKAAKNGGEGEG